MGLPAGREPKRAVGIDSDRQASERPPAPPEPRFDESSAPPGRRRKAVLAACSAAWLCAAFLMPFSIVVLVYPFPSWMAEALELPRMFFPLVWIFVAVAPYWILGLIYPRLSAFQLVAFGSLLAVLGVAVSVCGFRLEWRIKRHRLAQVARKMEPVIEAIEKFKTGTGAYPVELWQLVPEYLEKLPPTGMAGYPTLSYMRRESWGISGGRIIPTGGYQLSILTSSGILNWDRFFYWPNELYPEEGPGGWVETIGNWGYLHE